MTCHPSIQRSHHDAGWTVGLSGSGPVRTARRSSLFHRPHHCGGRKRCVKVRARGHTLHASPPHHFGEGMQVCDCAATGKTVLRSAEGVSQAVVTMLCIFSCSGACWWLRKCGCTCGEREEAPERGGDSQRRTRRSDRCSSASIIQSSKRAVKGDVLLSYSKCYDKE